MRRSLISAVFLALAWGAWAQSSVDSLIAPPVYDIERVSPVGGDETPKLKVGDELTLEVSGLNFPGVSEPSSEIRVELPAGEDLGRHGFAPLEAKKLPAGAPETGLRFSTRVMKSGKRTLPSLELRGSGSAVLGRTAPFEIEVESAIRPDDPAPTVPEDLRPAESLQFPWLVLVLAGIAVVSLVSGLIYAFMRWRTKPTDVASRWVEPPRSEDEIALAAFDRLEQERYAEQGRFKPHYFGVSEILKTYLGARYSFAAPEMTSGEILDWIRAHRPDFPQMRELSDLFGRLDLVKFTDQDPPDGDPTLSLAQAREIIRCTRRVVAPTPVVLPEAGGPRAV